MLGRWRNWDHPDAIDFPKLIRDLEALMRGESVVVSVRDQTKQTNFFKRERVALVPGPLVILEGYLALWHPDVREMADYSIFLDAPHDVRLERRRWKKSEGYVEQVLVPMHREHLEPTRAYAEAVFDTSKVAIEWLVEEVTFLLMPGM